jgi:para-aminobenzoate synthetase/4-amino-4-deoxychorismate lyase
MTLSTGNPVLVFDFCDEGGHHQRLYFVEPVRILAAYSVSEVTAALRDVEKAAKEGFYAAGYVSYEAAPAFDPALVVREGARLPLLWFGIFREPALASTTGDRGQFRVSNWQPSTSRRSYCDNVALVREAIARGDTYQVNYTIRLRAKFEGSAFAFYERLRDAQQGRYCAYVDTGKHQILSASPELFFSRTGSHILSRPMKGTVSRGRWSAEDEQQQARLAVSEKDRAENVMIVDLVRNDLGRIAQTGSVHVSSLFDVERYPTVFQMTSTIEAELRKETTLDEVFGALFPCGSVTGAPKISTTGLIRELEDSPREVYCGAIGLIKPGGDCTFNVAIRTVIVDSESGMAEYGVGGGITWGSTPEGEYEEALTKAGVLTHERPKFQLLETLKLENGQYTLLERHRSGCPRRPVILASRFRWQPSSRRWQSTQKIIPASVGGHGCCFQKTEP